MLGLVTRSIVTLLLATGLTVPLDVSPFASQKAFARGEGGGHGGGGGGGGGGGHGGGGGGHGGGGGSAGGGSGGPGGGGAGGGSNGGGGSGGPGGPGGGAGGPGGPGGGGLGGGGFGGGSSGNAAGNSPGGSPGGSFGGFSGGGSGGGTNNGSGGGNGLGDTAGAPGAGNAVSASGNSSDSGSSGEGGSRGWNNNLSFGGYAAYHFTDPWSVPRQGVTFVNQLGTDLSLSQEELLINRGWQNGDDRGTPNLLQASQVFPRSGLKLDYSAVDLPHYDYAVIIGNGDYTAHNREVPAVVPAYADSQSVRQFITDGLKVPQGNIIELADASLAQMQSLFGTQADPEGRLQDYLPKGAQGDQSDIRVFVYYSGHGAPSLDSMKGYLVPIDSDIHRLDLSGYSLDTLTHNLSRLPVAQVTLVVEACFSGLTANGNLSPQMSGLMVTPKMNKPDSKVTLITAGTASQVASWERDQSISLFTKYFLKAMSGEADDNKDRQVSGDELERYLDQTLSYWSRRYFGRNQQAQIQNQGRREAL